MDHNINTIIIKSCIKYCLSIDVKVSEKDVVLSPLPGLSNIIYKAEINNSNLKPIVIRINAESDSIDREFEILIIRKMAELNYTAEVLYVGDNNKIKIEVFLEGYRNCNRELLLNDKLLKKLFSVLKDFESIDFSVSDKQKFECSKFLSQSLISVKSNINNLNKFTLYDNNLKDKIELIKSIIENYDKIIAEMFDDKNNIQVISHNDIHLANILLQENLNIDSFKLIDYVFTCYNYFGFDIANYIVESFFELY